MLRTLCIASVWVWCNLAGIAAAQILEPGTSQGANTAYLATSEESVTHLRTAASYLRNGEWENALDLYDRVTERLGDKMVRLGDSPVYVSTRDFCQLQLLRLPTDVMQLYRRRVDQNAESWFQTGRDARDVPLLERVVTEAFCSSWGDDALDALAEIAFEAGRFEEARALWSRIRTDSDPPPANLPTADLGAALVYPDTNLDIAAIDAKRIVCRLFAGLDGRRQLEEFRRRYSDRRGRVAGQTRRYVELLDELALAAPAAPEPTAWATFAGSMQRSQHMPRHVDVGSVQWSVELPATQWGREVRGFPSRVVQTNSSDDALSYHPIVVRNLAIVCMPDQVRAYHLQKGPDEQGKPAWTYFLNGERAPAGLTVSRQSVGAPQYTLSADGDRLYARLGSPETTVPFRGGFPVNSVLVCLSLLDGREIWRVAPDQAEFAFEGSPVVANDSVFVATTRGGSMRHAYVAKYDAADGQLQWRQLVCEAPQPSAHYQASISHNLLTFGGGAVYYVTNLGAAAALEASTGRIRWIWTYPRDPQAFARRGGIANWYLNPAVYDDGRVLFAPVDRPQIFAVDAQSGELLWETPPGTFEIDRLQHLLGVTDGKLIASGTYVFAIDVASGKRVWQWPETQGVQPYGRGLLAGDHVYVPEKTNVHVIDRTTGMPAKPPIAVAEVHGQLSGNLAVADDYLVMAGKRLTVYCQYEALIRRFRQEITARPKAAEAHFKLAHALDATGAWPDAVAEYRASFQLAGPNEICDGRPIRQESRRQLHKLLQQLGENDGARRLWESADRHLRAAEEFAPDAAARLHAGMSRGALWESAGELGHALTAYQELLARDELQPLSVSVSAQRSVRADVAIATRIDELLARGGRKLYEPYETAARTLFDEAAQHRDPARWERLARVYPNSTLLPDTLLALGASAVERHQFAIGATRFKQVLDRSTATAAARATALEQLARLQETQQLWSAARETWLRLAVEHPQVRLQTAPAQAAATFVADHLRDSPLATAVRLDRFIRLPLERRWTRDWGDASRVIIPQGTPPPELGQIFLVDSASKLTCVTARTGQPLWSGELARPLVWAALYREHILVATAGDVRAVRAATGEVEWRYACRGSVADLNTPLGPVGPLRRTDLTPAGSESDAAAAEFTLVDDRLCFREGQHRLTVLSADTGELQYVYAPTQGTLAPFVAFNGQHIVLRTLQPGRLIGLDADGRPRFEEREPDEPWRRPPVWLDANRLCSVTDARRVELLDVSRGRPVWNHAFESPDSERAVEPIVAPGNQLFVLAGTQLIRIDSDTGAKLWSKPIADQPLSDSPGVWVADNDRLYCVTQEPNLRAFRLRDGELLWQQFLAGPIGRWQLRLAHQYVVAVPTASDVVEGTPVLICRREDGRLAQRIFLRPEGRSTLMHIGGGVALVGSERSLWLLDAATP